MLKPENRLRKMKDFEILFKEGRFVAGSFLTLKIWKIQANKYPKRKYEEGELRIGFIVSTKISKKAVERNRLKRQMRETVRLLIKVGKIKTGYHIAMIAKPNLLHKEYADIEKDILNILSMSKVLL